VNENLVSLDLGYNEIKDKGAFALASAIKNNANGRGLTIVHFHLNLSRF